MISGSGILITMYPQRWKPHPECGKNHWGMVHRCQGQRSGFRTVSCVGQQYKAALTSPWCDLQWEMQRADLSVFRDGLRRGVAREERSGVWYFKLGCWKQCGEHERGEERLLLFRDSYVAMGPLQQLVCMSAECLIHCSFSKVTFFLEVRMKAADFQPNNTIYNELTTSFLRHCCSRN